LNQTSLTPPCMKTFLYLSRNRTQHINNEFLVKYDQVNLDMIQNPADKLLLVEGTAPAHMNNKTPYISSSSLKISGYGSDPRFLERYKKVFMHGGVKEVWFKRENKTWSWLQKVDQFNSRHQLNQSYAVPLRNRYWGIINHNPPSENGFTYYGSEFSYFSGFQNILFADFHIELKSDFWMDQNSTLISSLN